jgi:hypothetical protein
MIDRLLKSLCQLTCFVLLNSPQLAFSVEGIITNADGRMFEGELKVQSPDALSLELRAGEGSVSYVFKREALAGIKFLDAEAVENGLDAYKQKQYKIAISYLEEVHRSRNPFFKWFPHSDLAEPSMALGEAYLQTKNFTNATGVAGVLLAADFADPTIHQKAEELLLLAFFGLQRWDETEVLAKRWCETHQPFDESALGWWLLSEVHLVRGELEKARWVSLQPITFSSQFPKEYLQECYQVAMASFVKEFPDQAKRLYREYRNRGYDWPNEVHPETKLNMVALALSMSDPGTKEQEEAPLMIEEGSPKKDLNLPLKTVRKLTSQPEPRSAQ